MANADKYLVKVTKGMFKFTDNTITTEITKGVYLNLKAEYKWNSNTELDLKLSWEPHSSEGPYSASSLTTSFSSPLGELNINGTRIGNQTLENTYNTTLTDINSNAQNITITFKYVNGNALVDLTQDFNKLVIPKPNKYDNNVVFNRDGLNEMIDYFLKYPVRSIEESENYGHITIAHGKDEAEDIYIKGLGHNDAGLTITTNLLPNEDATYDLGVKDEENEDNNLRWKNLYLSNNANVDGVVKANELEGLLTGRGININDKFKVDDEGNVIMGGNITWGDNNAFGVAYHKGILENNIRRIPDPPTQILTDILTEDNEVTPIWHKTLNSVEMDWFMSMTFNGGQQWTNPIRINAQDGAEGEVKNTDVLEALKAINADGLYTFPTIKEDGTVDGRLGIKATALLAGLANIGALEMGIGSITGDANGSIGGVYNATDNTTLSGGYITFPIPAPFQVSIVPDNQNKAAVNTIKTIQITGANGDITEEQVTVPELINRKGWRGRIGYLRGNGNGIIYNGRGRNTAGMGVVVYTNATFADFYDKNKVEINVPARTATDVLEKSHLVLSFLMLTDSGLALMTAANQYNPDHWLFLDLLTSGSFAMSAEDEAIYEAQYQKDLEYWPGMVLDQGRYPHYQYRWWSGGKGEGVNIPRIARLWLHEDNGGLYYSYDCNKDGKYISFTPWNWSGEG